MKIVNGTENTLMAENSTEYEKKINLCIANQCFLKCPGCYNNFCKSELISYDKLRKFLEYARKNGLEKVTLSGGDPLTRTDIKKIIEKCLELQLKVNLDTLGLPFIEDSRVIGSDSTISQFDDIELLKKISMIGIPMDGSSDEISSKFRKYKGNLFEKQMLILDFFESHSIPICINTVFHKGNSDDMENIYRIIEKYDCIKKWQVFQFMAIGPLGKLNEDIYKVEKNTFLAVKQQLEAMNSKNRQIEFKPAEERACNYMLVNSNGQAYKVDLSNEKTEYGNIGESDSWPKILKNLC